MKSTGIIMSQPMIIADLAGEKFQTRRTWGLNKINESPDDWGIVAVFQDGVARFYSKIVGHDDVSIKCPYGGIGDSVWCKETWRPVASMIGGGVPRLGIQIKDAIEWKANNPNQLGKWKSSMFMKREYSRRKHVLTNIRCERVQEITEDDAKLEGVGIIHENQQTIPEYWESYKKTYSVLWDELNFKRGYPWDKNIWVWVLEWKE
jgi:hypothetical protein